MKEKIWAIAIVGGILIALWSLVAGGLGPLSATAGALTGLVFVVAGILVRRMRRRKAPVPSDR